MFLVPGGVPGPHRGHGHSLAPNRRGGDRTGHCGAGCRVSAGGQERWSSPMGSRDSAADNPPHRRTGQGAVHPADGVPGSHRVRVAGQGPSRVDHVQRSRLGGRALAARLPARHLRASSTCGEQRPSGTASQLPIRASHTMADISRQPPPSAENPKPSLVAPCRCRPRSTQVRADRIRSLRSLRQVGFSFKASSSRASTMCASGTVRTTWPRTKI